mmetsp:Transcript_129136/g.306416  ORF Transcript_129136/g.306416 Transcript_129136/m.306416 type:complete len:211 (+) Transcript_129136:532-1164(+)
MLGVFRIQCIVDVVDALLFKVGDEHGPGADTLLMTSVAPEALVHQQRAADASWLSSAQRLDRCAKTAVHDEAVYLREQQTKVDRFGFEEGLQLLAFLRRFFQVIWPLLDAAHVNHAHRELAICDDLENDSQKGPALHWHTAEADEAKLCTCFPRVADEGASIPQRPGLRGGCLLAPQEKEVRLDDALRPVLRSLKSTRSHRNDDRNLCIE